MDRRSWPWRKKSSDKATPAPEPVAASANGTIESQENQDIPKNVDTYVQVPQERYTQLSDMEDQVKLLTEQLSTAQSELSTKDTLIKQHTKVAEEAVSGWEKAEAEALTLKNQLESVTLLKLTAEDRVVHLDGALKECMKQVRNVKEESEQKLHDVIFAKTNQWEKVKFELEEKINMFEQELLQTTAENDALSRVLQERSDMLMNLSEEKAEAETENEILKTNIQSCEKELSSMKYEVHIISKELEIRSEEKNMSVRSAEAANKQHLEDVKKITKLEAECQRLRGLVRKKLPGPAALAQMKLEVESFGRDHGEGRSKRSPVKNSFPQHQPVPDFALENIQQCQKENEFLTARLLATEEETKMLKEALSKRNSELQASRNMFAKTASRLKTLESQVVVLNQQRSPSKSNIEIPIEGLLGHNESKSFSLASMSEDGNDEEASCNEGSWTTTMVSDLSHLTKDKENDRASRTGSSSHLELMDDFLEMERLACSAEFSAEGSSLLDAPNGANSLKEEQSNVQSTDRLASSAGQTTKAITPCQLEVPLSKVQSRITLLFEGQDENATMGKLLESIKLVVSELEEEMPPQPTSCTPEDIQSVDTTICTKTHFQEKDKISSSAMKPAIDVEKVISRIHDSVMSFAKYNTDPGNINKVSELSSVISRVLSGELCVDEFIVTLSSVLYASNEVCPGNFGDKESEKEVSSPDCVDKVTLLENKIVHHENGKHGFSDYSADGDILQERFGPEVEEKSSLARFSLEEFEKLKTEKDIIADYLASCTESLEQTKVQLLETEKNLEDLKLQLTASQKSNSLAETQLKCMVESYRLLESQSSKLESENDVLRSKNETLFIELKEERLAHQEDLSKIKYLEEQMERDIGTSIYLDSSAEVKQKQEMEIAAAAEKLAECQETIFLLGRQLKSLHPQSDPVLASPNNHTHAKDHLPEDNLVTSGLNLQGWPGTKLLDVTETENATFISQKSGGESPLEGYGHYSPDSDVGLVVSKSPANPKIPKHSRSSRSSTSPNTLEEKNGKGFSRFFSKGKSTQ